MFSPFLFILISNEKLCEVQTNASLCLETAHLSLLETEIPLSILDGLPNCRGKTRWCKDTAAVTASSSLGLNQEQLNNWPKPIWCLCQKGGCTAYRLKGNLLLSFWGVCNKCHHSAGVLKHEDIHLQDLGFSFREAEGVSSKSRSQLRTDIPIPHRSPSPGLSQSERWDSVPVLATSQMPYIKAWV